MAHFAASFVFARRARRNALDPIVLKLATELKARAAQSPAPKLVRLAAALTCCALCTWAAALMRTGFGPSGWEDTMKEQPPSDTGQQSSIFKGDAMAREAITSATLIGLRNWAPSCKAA